MILLVTSYKDQNTIQLGWCELCNFQQRSYGFKGSPVYVNRQRGTHQETLLRVVRLPC